MTMHVRTLTALMCGVIVLGMSATLHAGNESNRNAVRERVSQGGWQVVWGVTVNEAEYAKFAASCWNGGFAAYFGDYLDRTVVKVSHNGPDVAQRAVLEAVNRCFRSRGGETKVGRMGVKAGIATYQRWYEVTAKVPDGTERYKIYGPRNPFTGKKTWTYGYRPKFKTIKKKVPLPNHHQPYVAFRMP